MTQTVWIKTMDNEIMNASPILKPKLLLNISFSLPNFYFGDFNLNIDSFI